MKLNKTAVTQTDLFMLFYRSAICCACVRARTATLKHTYGVVFSCFISFQPTCASALSYHRIADVC